MFGTEQYLRIGATDEPEEGHRDSKLRGFPGDYFLAMMIFIACNGVLAYHREWLTSILFNLFSASAVAGSWKASLRKRNEDGRRPD